MTYLAMQLYDACNMCARVPLTMMDRCVSLSNYMRIRLGNNVLAFHTRDEEILLTWLHLYALQTGALTDAANINLQAMVSAFLWFG